MLFLIGKERLKEILEAKNQFAGEQLNKFGTFLAYNHSGNLNI